MPTSYAEAGIDVARVKEIQRRVNKTITSTHGDKTLPLLGHYAGLFKAEGKVLAMHTDGVGTKVLVAQQVGVYDTVGIDCVAMNVNDLVCIGARPLALVDYIALEKEDAGLVFELMKGLVKGAKESDAAIVGGETAIMPDVIKGVEGRTGFDLAATIVGIVDEKKLITGARMQAGDAVIGLASSGVHSNGLSLARKVLPVEEFGRQMLTPTRIYSRLMLELVEKVDVRGIAHITGGAFSKLMRIGNHAKKGFFLDDMPRPHSVFQAIQERAGIDDREMHRTFNMGVGMCIAVPREAVEDVLVSCKNHRTPAKVIGRVINQRKVLIKKKGKTIRVDK
ncbi:phosphoribosylformylglycinamidine cyclo-ligase [Candidatus Micrarchaeota archaeon]|nr:phosphoribosylformylglycinamidine cyclo-ligase [Candidatus Micrarchaeota archaeon]